MMKRLLSLILSLLMLVAPITSGAQYLYTESQTDDISGGIKYEQKNILTDNGWIRAYIAYIDISNPNASIKVLTASKGSSYLQNVKSMAEDSGAAVAINGDFFNFSSTQTNMLGMVYKEGELVSTPALDNQASFVVTEDNNVIMDYFSFESKVTSPQGYVLPIYQINKVPVDSGAITMLTDAWGDVSYGKNFKELVVENDIVKEIRTTPGAIPQNGYVLVTNPYINGYFDNFTIGDTVTIETLVKPQIDNINEATGGNTVIVDNGQVSQFTGNVSGYAQRSSVGIMADGKTVILLATDGRQTDCRGLTQTELANLMISVGAVKAINLDGGGSTTFAKREYGEIKVMNSVSSLRPVSTALAGMDNGLRGQRAKRGVLTTQKPIVLLGDSIHITPTFYDEFDNVYDYDISSVEFVDSMGNPVYDGIFTPPAVGKYTIYASLDDAKCQIEVEAVNTIRSLDIDCNSAIKLNNGDTYYLSVSAYDNRGRMITANPYLLSWKSTNPNVSISNGEIKANTSSPAIITASYDGKSDSIVVNTDGTTSREPLSVAGSDDMEGYISGAQQIAVSGSAPKGATLLNRHFAISRLNELQKYNSSYIINTYYTEFKSTKVKAANSYNNTVIDGTSFATLDTSDGYIKNARQWANLCKTANSNTKNIVIITEMSPSEFPSYEEIRIKTILENAVANGKNVFYVYSDSKPQVTIENGVRYISVGEIAQYKTTNISDNKNYCSYLVFFVIGDEIKYKFVN